jgi:threonine/homoserine/homoserine lactone efflux protein
LLLSYLRRRHLFQLYHQERMEAMAKGLAIPPEPEAFLKRERAPKTRTRGGVLLCGLIWLFVGIAAYFALDAMAGRNPAMLALVPSAVGLAYLVYYAIDGRKLPGQPPENIDTSGALPLSAKS